MDLPSFNSKHRTIKQLELNINKLYPTLTTLLQQKKFFVVNNGLLRVKYFERKK